MKIILTASLTALSVCAVFWWLLRPGLTPPTTGIENLDALVAVDQAGKRIGPVVGAASTLNEAQVALDTPLGLAILGLRPDRFVHKTRPYIYFDDSNCRGNSFIGIGDEPEEFGVKSALAGELQTLYVAKSVGPELLEVKSVLRETACEPFEHEIHAVKADRVMDLAETYRAPYRIEKPDRDSVKK